MSADFDVRTAYFLLGMLCLAGALGVHMSLRARSRPRHQTWAWGGASFGGALLLVALRGWVPEVMTYELSHLLFAGALLLQASALAAEAGAGWRASRMATVLAVSGTAYAVLTALDRGWGLLFNSVVIALGSAVLVGFAWRIWRLTGRLPALVVAAGFGLLLLALMVRVLSLLQTTLGRGGPFEQGSTQVTLMMGGLFAIILGHLGYLGLQFLRMAQEQVETERAAAMEAERSRQVQERETALRGLLEERNQLIQRIARSETASDLALFATSLPHELSQPLCASLLNLESLRTVLERQGDPALLPVVRAIESSNERVLDLLQQLRILLRSHESGDRERLDLRALVQRTLPILEGSFREHHIRLVPTMPARPFEVLANPTQLQQLLLILCIHALDELRRQPMAEGGLQVRVGLEADAREVCLRVEHSGQRSGAELRRQLETEASQGAWTQEISNRLGLGLAVARRVVEAHLGRLEIRESWLGGAAFVLTLPTAQAATELAASAPAITPPPRQTSPS